MDDEPRGVESPTKRKGINRWLIVALVGAIAAGVLLASTVWDNRWQGEAKSAGDNATTKPESMEKWCGA